MFTTHSGEEFIFNKSIITMWRWTIAKTWLLSLHPITGHVITIVFLQPALEDILT